MLDSVVRVIEHSQDLLARKLDAFLSARDFDEASYVRYLSMQYHLTKGVQRYFLTAAANEALAHRKPFRRFLIEFADEEELHFELAKKDLDALGQPVLPMPFDVELWHAYFGQVTPTRPFVRLGAACVLENLSQGAVKEPLARLLAAPFLTRENTRFIVLHKHETLPHGDQILTALAEAAPTGFEVDDLTEGAGKGGLMYLRMVDWVLDTLENQKLLPS